MYTLTKHAVFRLRERCDLTIRDLINLIVNKQYIPLGTDGNREHVLIYSIVDEEYFTIIKDEKTKEIITILPPEYHNNISWMIDIDTLEEAKNLAILHKKFELKENIPEPDLKPKIPPSKFKLTPPTKYKLVGFYNYEDKQIPVGLGSVPINNQSVDALISTSLFWQHIYKKIKGKNIPQNNMSHISIRMGKHKTEMIRVNFKTEMENDK